MSSTIKIDKNQLSSYAEDMINKVKDLDSIISSLSETLKSIPTHSDFSSLTSKATSISSSVKNVYTDYDNVSTNIDTYIKSIIEIDTENVEENAKDNGSSTDTSGSTTVNTTNTSSNTSSNSWANNSGYKNLSYSNYSSSSSSNYSSNTGGNSVYSYSTGPSGTVVYTNNFSSSLLSSSDYNVAAGGKYNYEGIEKHLEKVEGVTVTLPEGLGSIHTYMGWQCITAVDSRQYKLRTAAGMNFDEEGFAKIGDRYVVAVTTTFGNVGDYIDVYQEDGTVIKCIIGDIKSQGDAGCTKWGHDNGQCVVEFVVDKSSWYGNRMHSNPGTSSCHPEWKQNITKIVNKGNYFELIKTDAAKFEEVVYDKDNTDTSESNKEVVV